MSDTAPTWRLLLLAAGCALASSCAMGLLLYGGYVWLAQP